MSPALPGEIPQPVRRCESCGLAVVGDPGGPEEALAALAAGRGSDGAIRIANRASLQAWLGGAAWALLAQGERFLFTAESARRLLALRGEDLGAARWVPLASVASMWQTLLNTLTFGHNVALARLGRLPGRAARHAWQRGLDIVISAVLALPLLLLATGLELADRAARRGGILVLSPSARAAR